MAGLFHIVPKRGPFKALAFESLTPKVEQLYMASFNSSIDRYRALLAGLGSGQLSLPNDNFDVGAVTKAGEYTLADAAYAKLLHKLDSHYADLPPDLRNNILTFYQDLSLPIATKNDAGDWAKLQDDLNRLQAINSELSAAGPSASTASGVMVAK
jgi:hypothetical protein